LLSGTAADFTRETLQFVPVAIECGYQVELTDPESPWWQVLRVLRNYNSD
jgi:hypothetical protein